MMDDEQEEENGDLENGDLENGDLEKQKWQNICSCYHIIIYRILLK